MASTPNVVHIFDGEFNYLFMVPSHLVVHTPSAHHKSHHFVICPNYRLHQPDSCMAGRNCKFVHADVDYSTLEAHPIHMNNIWRHEDLCTYERLPPGDLLDVFLPNNKKPSEKIASELILVTQAVLPRRRARAKPLSHCAHYYFNQLCHRGASCNFVHAVYVDSTIAGDFKRALCRSHRRGQSDHAKAQMKATTGNARGVGVGHGTVAAPRHPPVAVAGNQTPSTPSSETVVRNTAFDHSITSVRPEERLTSETHAASVNGLPRAHFYRHDPYRMS
ncbi:hypothetical protein ERJ75_000017300 [Trypanosoma vivax]|nr:hypothetical protein ERJ75_000017300 [Trypanosoma vivax]